MSLRLTSVLSAALFSACMLEVVASPDAAVVDAAPAPLDAAEVALPEDVPVPPPVAEGVRACGQGAVCMPPQADAAAACAQALPLLAHDGRIAWQASCSEPMKRAESAHPAVRQVVLFQYFEPDTTAHFALLVASDAGFDRFVPLYTASFMSITDMRFGFPRFELVEPSAGGAPRLHVQIDAHAETSECTGDLTWVSDASELALCRFDGAAPDCLSSIPLRTKLTETPNYYAEQPGLTRVLNDYELTVRVLGDGVDIQRRRGHVPRELRALYGRHSLATLRATLSELSSHH